MEIEDDNNDNEHKDIRLSVKSSLTVHIRVLDNYAGGDNQANYGGYKVHIGDLEVKRELYRMQCRCQQTLEKDCKHTWAGK